MPAHSGARTGPTGFYLGRAALGPHRPGPKGTAGAEVLRERKVRSPPHHKMSLLLTIRGHWAGPPPGPNDRYPGGGPSPLCF